MNHYNNVIKISERLKDDFKDLTSFQRLQIAAQIHISEVISKGLQSNNFEEPAYLEAIAKVIGFKKDRNEDILTIFKSKD